MKSFLRIWSEQDQRAYRNGRVEVYLKGRIAIRQRLEDVARHLHLARMSLNGPAVNAGTSLDHMLRQLGEDVQILIAFEVSNRSEADGMPSNIAEFLAFAVADCFELHSEVIEERYVLLCPDAIKEEFNVSVVN